MSSFEILKPSFQSPAHASSEIVDGIGTSLITTQSVRKVEREFGWLATMTEIVDPNLHLVEAAQLIRGGAYPIIYSNHTQHANISGFTEVVRALKSARPDRIYVPIARSLVNQDESAGGNQSKGLIEFAQAAAPFLERYGMHFVPVPRTKDVNMLLGMTPEEAEEASSKPLSKEMLAERSDVMEKLHEGRMNKKLILNGVKGNTGVALFPEETTYGGIKEGNGEYNGIGDVPNSLIPDVVTRALKFGRDVVFINLGMNGYGDVVPARTAEYNKTRIASWVIREGISKQLGIRLGESPIRVEVGKPFTLDDLRKNGLIVSRGQREELVSNNAVNEFCMQQVAKVVDQELRGKYK